MVVDAKGPSTTHIADYRVTVRVRIIQSHAFQDRHKQLHKLTINTDTKNCTFISTII